MRSSFFANLTLNLTQNGKILCGNSGMGGIEKYPVLERTASKLG